MYDTKEALIGDTFVNPGSNAIPLPGFKASKPVVLYLGQVELGIRLFHCMQVFAEIYPVEGIDFVPLKSAVEKLTLNDASVQKEPCTRLNNIY